MTISSKWCYVIVELQIKKILTTYYDWGWGYTFTKLNRATTSQVTHRVTARRDDAWRHTGYSRRRGTPPSCQSHVRLYETRWLQSLQAWRIIYWRHKRSVAMQRISVLKAARYRQIYWVARHVLIHRVTRRVQNDALCLTTCTDWYWLIGSYDMYRMPRWVTRHICTDASCQKRPTYRMRCCCLIAM